MSATRMADAMRRKELTSVEIVRAHIERIRHVNDSINAVCQIAERSALEAAAAADKAIMVGESTGPLHGVPFTVKDSFDTAGIVTTAGTLGWKDRVPTEDATVVSRLKEAGAILIGKTNTPELTLSHETDNLIYGKTNNPYNLAHSSGGSSGGAAAILAVGGSPLDVGSDTVGSIRVPSHFCGIAGLKPSFGRIPRTGHVISAGGPIGRLTQIGPMARRVEDLVLTFPILAGPDGIDPDSVPPYFTDPSKVDLATLRVAYFSEFDRNRPVAPEIRNVVTRAANELSGSVASAEEARPPSVAEAALLGSAISSGDGGQYYQTLLRECGTRRAHSSTREILNISRSQLVTAKKYSSMLLEWAEIRKAMLAFMDDFDIVVCPVTSTVAPRHGKGLNTDFGYSTTFNLVGWPSVVVRAGTSPEGLPIGVQIVGAPWMEHKILAVAALLEERTGGWKQDFLQVLM